MIIRIVCCLFRCFCCLKIKTNIFCDNKIRCIKIFVRLCVVLLWRFEAEVGCSSCPYQQLISGPDLRRPPAAFSPGKDGLWAAVCAREVTHSCSSCFKNSAKTWCEAKANSYRTFGEGGVCVVTRYVVRRERGAV